LWLLVISLCTFGNIQICEKERIIPPVDLQNVVNHLKKESIFKMLVRFLNNQSGRKPPK